MSMSGRASTLAATVVPSDTWPFFKHSLLVNSDRDKLIVGPTIGVVRNVAFVVQGIAELSASSVGHESTYKIGNLSRQYNLSWDWSAFTDGLVNLNGTHAWELRDANGEIVPVDDLHAILDGDWPMSKIRKAISGWKWHAPVVDYSYVVRDQLAYTRTGMPSDYGPACGEFSYAIARETEIQGTFHPGKAGRINFGSLRNGVPGIIVIHEVTEAICKPMNAYGSVPPSWFSHTSGNPWNARWNGSGFLDPLRVGAQLTEALAIEQCSTMNGTTTYLGNPAVNAPFQYSWNYNGAGASHTATFNQSFQSFTVQQVVELHSLTL